MSLTKVPWIVAGSETKEPEWDLQRFRVVPNCQPTGNPSSGFPIQETLFSQQSEGTCKQILPGPPNYNPGWLTPWIWSKTCSRDQSSWARLFTNSLRSSPEPWSVSTDSKILDYQKTNPREYQIVRTHTKKTIVIKDCHHPTTNKNLCRKLHVINKQNNNTNSRQDCHLTQLCLSEEKQTNKQTENLSTNLTL